MAPNAPVDEVFEVAVDDHDTIVPGSSLTADTVHDSSTSVLLPPVEPAWSGSTPSESVPSGTQPGSADSSTPSTSGPCPDKPPARNHRLQAAFGCWCTHNEEMMTCPCGVILLQEMFYGLETVPQVLVHCIV